MEETIGNLKQELLVWKRAAVYWWLIHPTNRGKDATAEEILESVAGRVVEVQER